MRGTLDVSGWQLIGQSRSRRVKARLATAVVPMKANSATATADGMVVRGTGRIREDHVAAEDTVEQDREPHRDDAHRAPERGHQERSTSLLAPPRAGHPRARYISSSQTRGAPCVHTAPVPPADHRDRDAARTVAFHPERGWSLLCNGVIVFDDMGEILPGGRVTPPQVSLSVAA